jgi:hypothetical protein
MWWRESEKEEIQPSKRGYFKSICCLWIIAHYSNDKNFDWIESMFVLLLHLSRGGCRLHDGGCQWFEDSGAKKLDAEFFSTP